MDSEAVGQMEREAVGAEDWPGAGWLVAEAAPEAAATAEPVASEAAAGEGQAWARAVGLRADAG